MKRSLKISAVFFASLLAILACVTPAMNTPDAPGLETVVAQTMRALTPAEPAPNDTPSPPSGTPSLLPHSLYYLNADSSGIVQVYRLEKDGETVQQITFEPGNVDAYAVSPVDGSLAYVSNNQLLLVESDGSKRRILVDGGPVDENNPFLSTVGSPAWSPGGETIAYYHGGLNFYAVSTGFKNKVLENILEDANGFFFPRELYFPERYSPDGTKLLLRIGFYEGGTVALYYPPTGTLVRLSGDDSGQVCCTAHWAPDSNTLYAANPYLGMLTPGLWSINASTGLVTTLLPGDAGDGTFNFARAPIVAPDGQLYFFFNNLDPGDNFVSNPSLYMVRSASDGFTGRDNLYITPFEKMNEVLWVPDASFAVIAFAPADNVYQGGEPEIVYVDGSPSVKLVPFAQDMRWGP